MDPEYRTADATGMLAAAARRGTHDAVPATLYLQRCTCNAEPENAGPVLGADRSRLTTLALDVAEHERTPGSNRTRVP